MRHQVHGKKLNKSTSHRNAMYHNMVQSLVDYERITTTLVKAKAVRPIAEKLITRAKDGDLAARRAVIAFLPQMSSAQKVCNILAPRFAQRPGGYTRIIKLGRRMGDGADLAILEFVDAATATKPSTPKKIKKVVVASKKPKTIKAAKVASDTSVDEKGQG